MDALRINRYGDMHPPEGGLALLRMPLLHIDAVIALPGGTVTDIAAMLVAIAESDGPKAVRDPWLLPLTVPSRWTSEWRQWANREVMCGWDPWCRGTGSCLQGMPCSCLQGMPCVPPPSAVLPR